ncbi:MAG: DNA polymerase Y family protein, partial [Acidimicrobiales bacterium]
MSSRGAPPRTLVAWCPDWPVVATGCSDDLPVAVLEAGVVIAASAMARAQRVHPGLRKREAQARSPRLIVEASDPGRDARAFEPFVCALEEMAPGVEVLHPGTMALATRGP